MDSTIKSKIQQIRNFNSNEFFNYITNQLPNTELSKDDTRYLEREIERLNDPSYLKRFNYENKYENSRSFFHAINKGVIKYTLDNIEKTMNGQPIYREITVCNPKGKTDVDLTRTLIQEPIGDSWSYYDDTFSINVRECPNDEIRKPILIKAKLLDPEGIDIDKTLLINMNWTLSSLGSENEIRLKKRSKVQVLEICEKRWGGSKRKPLKELVKQCHSMDKIFHN